MSSLRRLAGDGSGGSTGGVVSTASANSGIDLTTCQPDSPSRQHRSLAWLRACAWAASGSSGPMRWVLPGDTKYHWVMAVSFGGIGKERRECSDAPRRG